MPDKRKPSRTCVRRIIPTVLLCGFAYCGTRAADKLPHPEPEQLHQIGSDTQRLEIGDSDSVLIQFPEWLTRVRSGDARVIRVTAVRPDCLRVTRLTAGRTTLTALDRRQREYAVELSLGTTRQP